MKLGNSVALFPHCFSVYSFINLKYMSFPINDIACSSKFLGSVILNSAFCSSIFSCASLGVTIPHNLENVFILNGKL